MDAWEIFEGDELRGRIKKNVVVSPFGWRHFIKYMLSRFDEVEEIELSYFDQRVWNVKKPKEFTFIYSNVGPTNADLVLLLLKGSGVKNLFLVGSAGGLGKDMKPGEIVIPEEFNTEECTSLLWAEPPYRVDSTLFNRAVKLAEDLNIPHHTGKVVTVDSLHRQVRLNLSDYAAVEMEGSVLAAASEKLGYRFLAVFWLSDIPAKGEKLRDPLSDSMKMGINRALDIVLRIME